MITPTDEQVKKAEALITRDPARAAWHLAELTNKLEEAETTLNAIRSFSQNTWLAKEALARAKLNRHLDASLQTCNITPQHTPRP